MSKPDGLEVIISKIGNVRDVATYTSIESWDSDTDYPDSDILSVGIVKGHEILKHGSQEPQYMHAIKWEIENSAKKFLLLHSNGKKIAWSFKDDKFFDENALDENSEAYWDNNSCISEIQRFIEERHIGEYNLNWQTFNSKISNTQLNILVPEFDAITKETITYLSKHPDLLYEIKWRKFEKLLEEIFKLKGFETKIGPGRGDGGVDLRLIQRSDIGEMLILVQAKRYAKHLRIKLDPVKALWASVDEERATKGLFVSTCEFQPAVRRFADRYPYKIKLVGHNELTRWLKEIGRMS